MAFLSRSHRISVRFAALRPSLKLTERFQRKCVGPIHSVLSGPYAQGSAVLGTIGPLGRPRTGSRVFWGTLVQRPRDYS